MVKLFIKHFDHDGVAVGGTFEQEWKSDGNYIIKYILIKRKDGAEFTASDITIRIQNIPITKDHALCHTFGRRIDYALPINEELRETWVIDYAGTNREGAAVDLVVELILELIG